MTNFNDVFDATHERLLRDHNDKPIYLAYSNHIPKVGQRFKGYRIEWDTECNKPKSRSQITTSVQFLTYLGSNVYLFHTKNSVYIAKIDTNF